MKKIITAEGMSCQHCVNRVTKMLSAVAGVNEVAVDLAAQKITVTMTGEVSEAALSGAVEKAGFAVLSVGGIV